MENESFWPVGQGGTERFKLLVDTVSDYAMFILDETGTVLSWNAGAQRMSGFSPDQIVGRSLNAIFADDIKNSGLAGGMMLAASQQGRFASNLYLACADGTNLPVQLTIEPLKGADGKGYAASFRSLDGEENVSAALTNGEDVFRRLILNVSDYAIIMLTVDGRISSWNKGAELITGYRASEIIGTHFSHFHGPETRAIGVPDKALAEVRDKGHYHEEGWRIRKDGSRYFASIAIDAIRDDSGQLIGYAKIVRDITVRMKQQKSLEIAREEIFQAQKLEAIGQLTGGVAHDFNNLLMVVMGSLEVLKRRLPAEDRNSRLIDNAYQAAQRGAQLTKRMLAFARKEDLEKQAVDLPELVRGMSALLSRTLGHTIMIETRFPVKLSRINADPQHLDAALLSLAVNARDAMPKGGNLVFAAREHVIGEGHAQLKPGKYVCLVVEDNGEGMDEVTLSRATEPFFTTKGVGTGTGLGLPMVQGLAAQAGGMMQIYSAKGRGTSVELWLEALEDEEPAMTAPCQTPPAPSLSAKRCLKVLAVDDDALVLLNTSMMLEELGHEVVEAHSAADALKQLEAHDDFDLVITDHAMPRMTGVEMAEEIARRWPAMPVALASGYADIEQARRMNLPRLAKPFTQNELAGLISKIYESSAA